MAALRATQEEPDAISGVFWFAGGLRGGGYDFNEEDVAQVAVPLLLVIATNDPLVQPRTVELLAEWATAPTQVLMLESDLHGTDVLEAGGTPAQQVLDSVTAFLAQ
jgi:dienelactone hydrolase